ncbi:FG-GAP repeat protein [Candidatus Woesearchaeota archaeon]|nr:FG-GAP repeat protein [Candidatus Woesearchaeota archaeon]
MRKRGELGSVLIITAAVVLLLASALTILKGGITGYTVFPPTDVCYENPYACTDLNGDGRVTVADEEIFALILNGTITRDKDPEIYDRADFDNDSVVTNAIDFQQCFVYLRDQANDRTDGKVTCHLPRDNLTQRTNLSACLDGCPDLDGDGYVRCSDYTILIGLFGQNVNETVYPMADLTGDGIYDWQDRDCLVAYFDKVVTCNMPVHAFHLNSCPDLTDDANTGNDGFVKGEDLGLFNQYETEQNLKADFNDDGKVDGLDRLIFMQYYEKVVDCDIYHAPWHVGGRDRAEREETSTYQNFGGDYKLAQSFYPSYEGQLTKIRFLLGNNSGTHNNITVGIYEVNATNAPNETVLIDSSTIEGFSINESKVWATAYFRVPSLLRKKYYSIVLSSPNSSNNSYRWYYSNTTKLSYSLSNADASFIGESDGDSSSESIASGDVNNDGYDDILIGANVNDDGGSDAGKTYLIYGPVSGDIGLSDADVSFIGENGGDRSGISVASGDVNNDGYDDILIGAAYNNDGGSAAGKTYLIYGPVYGNNINLSDADASFIGENSSDVAGWSVASGDVNNDGYDDILIGAKFNDDGGSTAGKTYLIYGPVYGDIDLSDADASFIGENGSDESGDSVASGDVNNDGYDDILIGAYANDYSGSFTGKTYLIYGPVYGNNINLSDANASFIGENGGDASGWSVASGDVNKDGYDDILIGARNNGDSEYRAGKTYLIYGPVSEDIGLSNADVSFIGESDSDYSGNFIASGLNNYGSNYILIGAWANDDGGSQAGKTYLFSIEDIPGNKWNWTGSTWVNETQKDAIFEPYISTACADIDSTGVCDSDDEDIINKIPDGLNEGGVGIYDIYFDLNNDHVINKTDYDIINDSISSSGYLEKPTQDINNVGGMAGIDNFGDGHFLAQSFNATSSKISKISLPLAANSFIKRDITLEIRTDFNGSPESSIDSTEINGFSDRSFKWYNFTFDSTVNLSIGEMYHIVVSATETSIADAYNWSKVTAYPDGNASKSTNYGVNWTNISSDFRFITYGGDSKWNESYDLNNDNIIDDDDLALIADRIGSYDGSWWTPLVDFNAIFGLFERLLDKILGFNAYIGKVLKCGFDTWTIGINNSRCDPGENFTISPFDCPACNDDDFCASSEDFDNCSDCAFWKALPKFSKFNGDTTPFYDYYSLGASYLEAIPNLILEILPYGKIEFSGPINVTGLDFDSYVDIFFNNASVDITALPELNRSANISLYNLSSVYPNILLNGAVCPEDICTFMSYSTGGDITFHVTGFSWYSTEELGPNASKFNGSTTDFSITNLPQMFDITNVSNVTLEKTDYGKIVFLEPINITNADFNSYIKMGYKWISIDLIGLPNLLNKSAELSFYNISFTYPIILEDSIRCRENCSFVRYENGIFTVNVSLNSNYSVEEAAPDVEEFNGTTTNFSINDLTVIKGEDIENVSDMTLEKTTAGKIEFLDEVNASKGEYDEHIEISLNGGSAGGGWVDVNSSADAELNKSARIYLYNLSLYNPVIRKGEVTLSDCVPPECNIEDYDGYPLASDKNRCDHNCTLVFNVSHFTRYHAMENTTGPQFINGPIPDATETLIMKENSDYEINLSYYFFDVDNDSADLIYTYEKNNPQLSISIVNTTAYLNALAGSVGVWRIEFNASDGDKSASTNEIRVVIAPNAPPQFNGPIPTQTWLEDTNRTIDLTEYFYDPDDNTLTYNFSCAGVGCAGNDITNITVEINQTTGIAALIPDTNWNSLFFGKRWIIFTAKDSQYPVSSTVTELDVTSDNDLPYMINATIDDIFQNGQFIDIIMEEDGVKEINLTKYIHDIEDDDWTMNFSLTATPVNFNVNLTDPENATFIPRGNWSGFEDFTIRVEDSDSGIMYTNEFTIYVTPVQDNVTRTNKTFNLTWNEDEPYSINLSDYFLDVDGDVVYFAYPQYINETVHVAADINYLSGEMNFTPKADWFGIQQINLSATDLVSTEWEIVNLTVINSNDAPELDALIPNQTWDEDTSRTINLTNYFVDPDKLMDPNVDNLTYNYSFVGDGSYINITINQSNGQVTLTPDKNWYGIRTIEFSATDLGNESVESNNVLLNVTPVNDAPILISKGFYEFANTNFSKWINASDPDGDTFFVFLLLSTYSNMNLSDYGLLNWTPVTNTSGNYTVNLTVCDLNNCTNSSVWILVLGPSIIINSWIDGNFTNGTFYEFDGIFESIINISNITNSTIALSNIFNSTLENSDMSNCTVSDSDLEDAECRDGIIDPSAIINSTTTGSTIVNCTLINTNLINSYCENSIIINTNASDANITDGVIHSGTIVMFNGSIYNASAIGDEDLKDLINYPPVAAISVSKTSAYTGDLIIFNGSLSSDPNIPGDLNDSLSYLWEFGDGINATGEVVNHSYSSTGKKYVLLTVTDKFDSQDDEIEEITISSKAAPSKSGGGGGGGGRRVKTVSIVLPTTLVVNYRERLQFIYEGAPHTLELSGIYADRVFLAINSPGFSLTVPYDQIVKVDITDDNITDIELTITRISSSKVTLTVRRVGMAPAVPEVVSCSDGLLNQDETAVDCGGSCSGCSDGKRCSVNSDCSSNNCEGSICVSCFDGRRNQGEADIDCGGPCAVCPTPAPTVEVPAFARAPPAREPANYLWLYVVLVVIIIIGSAGAAAYYWFEIGSKKHEAKPIETRGEKLKTEAKEKLRDYIIRTVDKGFDEKQIRDKLRLIGWPDDMVEEVFKELKK